MDLEQQIEDMQHNYPPSRLQAGEVPKSLSAWRIGARLPPPHLTTQASNTVA